jgi:tetratricopeptide (TPR) repeat protein
MERLLTSLFLLALLGYACSDDDLLQLDPNRVTPENFFQTESQLESTVFGAYATLRAGNAGGRLYFLLTDFADDHHEPTPDAAFFPIIAQGQQSASIPEIGAYWSGLYTLIHRANTALDAISENTTVDQSVKDALAGEARFLRGWAYNEIATLWGGAPIYTSRVKSLDEFQPRSSQEAVFEQARADLTFAADNLPATRPDEQLGRATRGAALGILGRSYMQTNDLPEARTALEALIDLGLYELNEDWFATFAEENDFTRESIFEIPYGDNLTFNWGGQATGDGTRNRSVRSQLYGPTFRNSYPSTELIRTFENTLAGDAKTDPRLPLTVIFEGDTYNNGTLTLTDIKSNGEPVDYYGEERLVNWYKHNTYYKRNPRGFNQTATNLIIIRLADVYLLMAEIEARDGNLEEARRYINLVRARVEMPEIEESRIPSSTQEEVIQAVIRERSVELASEQVRWRDIRRWDAAGIIDAEDILPFWTDNQMVFPIPVVELDNNPLINQADQNPGY